MKLLGVLRFAALFLGCMAIAQPARADEGRRERMSAELGLTDAQTAQIRDIDFQAKTGRIAMKARLEAARLLVRHELGAATLDEAAVAKALEAANAAAAEIGRSRVDQAIATRKVLTPEQWAKASALRDAEGPDREEGDRRGDPEDRGDRERGDRDARGDRDGREENSDCDGTRCKECDMQAHKHGKQGKHEDEGHEDQDSEGDKGQSEPRWDDE